jgi:YebC/PmpR family DNA-binding regulatory protein
MSGHNKWSKVKHKKGKADAAKGKLYTKLIREIMVAARNGNPDPEMNASLRLAITRAREANMPNDNIDRAIKKATGGEEGLALEEAVFEGYGPGGVAVMVEVVTDNRKRAVADLRNMFAKLGGNLGESGCVSWVFDKKAVFTFDRSAVDPDALLEMALDAGADDVKEEGADVTVLAPPAEFEKLRKLFEGKGLKPTTQQIAMIPKNTVALAGDDAEKFVKFLSTLEEHDDVQNVYGNFDIPDEVLERAAAA